MEQQEKIVDANTGTESNYLRFENNKRIYCVVTRWRTVETIKTFQDKQKLMVVWRADCLKYGDSPTYLQVCLPAKTVELGNIQFRKQINTLLAGKDTTGQFMLSIKRLGEGKQTTYDVELVP